MMNIKAKTTVTSTALVLALTTAAGYAQNRGDAGSSEATKAPLTTVATYDDPLITGVAVSREGRVFFSSPRWFPNHPGSLFEVMPDGSRRLYPDAATNNWRSPTRKNPDLPAAEESARQIVSGQSVTIDAKNRMWVMDPAKPSTNGPGSVPVAEDVPGGPKLMQIDLEKNRVARVFSFEPAVLPKEGYLNDVRVDTSREVAFITESGTGAFIVLDLKTGKSMRRLATHPSTKGDPKLTMVFPDGRKWMFTSGPNKGQKPNAPLDGLALDTENGYIYYQALSNNKLYRIPTAVLSNMKLPEAEVEKSVEFMGKTVFSDGMEADDRGNVYFTAVEKNAIVVWSPDGKLTTLVQGSVVSWPDGFARHNDDLYFSVAQIHRTAVHSVDNSNPNTPYRVMKTKQLGQ